MLHVLWFCTTNNCHVIVIYHVDTIQNVIFVIIILYVHLSVCLMEDSDMVTSGILVMKIILVLVLVGLQINHFYWGPFLIGFCGINF